MWEVFFGPLRNGPRPASRSNRANAISGKPTSAVGSLLSMRSNREIPRPSHLKLPAQSSGISRST